MSDRPRENVAIELRNTTPSAPPRTDTAGAGADSGRACSRCGAAWADGSIGRQPSVDVSLVEKTVGLRLDLNAVAFAYA
jgi:hypothetical protein